MKKILIAVDTAVPFLDGRFDPDEVDLRFLPTAEINHDTVKDADAILGHTRTYCTADMLRGTNVKMIATATIGMDHIDCDWCAKNGIAVKNAPGCNAPGVAQYVWSSLMACGFEPKGSTVGVVGVGNVGSVVAHWGRLLGANVLLCDPPKKILTGDESYRPLEEIIPQCDVLTLHTPLTRTGDHPTFHLIDAEKLKLMPDNSILVNAARGAVLDTQAVKNEVNECRIRAIIDTWEGEPNVDRELLDMAEIATPHIAGYSLEGKQRATRMSLENLAQHFGIHVDTTGLPPNYELPESLDRTTIRTSYNPYADMARFVTAPDTFETLRGTYNFRKEA